MHKYVNYEKIMHSIDVIDKKILKMMQADALLSVTDIALRVGVGTASCWRRGQTSWNMMVFFASTSGRTLGDP